MILCEEAYDRIDRIYPVFFKFKVIAKGRFAWGHKRSHRTGCTGPDPTNFWESNMYVTRPKLCSEVY